MQDSLLVVMRQQQPSCRDAAGSRESRFYPDASDAGEIWLSKLLIISSTLT